MARAQSQHYSHAQWEVQRSLITRLYVELGRPVKDVVKALAERNFHVNKRMLMTRVTAWGIGRKNRMPEMCAAVRLLANDDFAILSGSTSFVIRGQDISLDEIRRYFRRKGCSNPVTYVQNIPEEKFINGLDVRLRNQIYRDRPTSSDSTSNQQSTPETRSSESPPPSSDPIVEPRVDVAEIGTHLQDEQHIDTVKNQVLSSNSSPLTQLSDGSPAEFASFNIHLSITTPCRNSDAMLWATKAYINAYAVSIRQRSHYEPRAHYQTLHGQFSFQIQESVACRERSDMIAAIKAHRQALSLIDGIVSEDHPMSMTLILSLMCELLQGGNLRLVKHIAQCMVQSNTKLQRHHHLMSILFRALLNLESLEGHHIYCTLRLASENFDFLMGANDWRSMYLKERLCDALYHSQEVDERVHTRDQLLRDQMAKYGPNARNVLFTQMNVADDLASLHETERALAMYEDALNRAESQTDDHGFSRSRIRFAALEGLGSLRLIQAQMETGFPWNAVIANPGLLEQAVECFGLAEAEATAWFEATSKRSQRIIRRKREAQDLLDMCLVFDVSDASSWDLMSDLSRI